MEDNKRYSQDIQNDLLNSIRSNVPASSPLSYNRPANERKGGDYRPNYGQEKGGNSRLNANAAKASVLGFPFHNPYTFIPFPDEAPARGVPTPLTIDEQEKDRVSGVIQVTIRTKSPLLTSEPSPLQEFKNDPEISADATWDKALKDKLKHHPVLRIGNDVIVPASSVRGSLRNLMSIICGGTLSYVDEELWLCQGRDAQLGGIKDNLYLARIEKPGTSKRSGTVTWGEARLVRDASLKELLKVKKLHSFLKKGKFLWIDSPENPTKYVVKPADWRPDSSNVCPWLVKISGQKVSTPGREERKDDNIKGLCNLLFKRGFIDSPDKNALFSAYLDSRNKHRLFPLWIDNPKNPSMVSNGETVNCYWKFDVRGKKIKFYGPPHEGAFKPAKTMELSKEFWGDYQGRNRNSDVKELHANDLIWLESKNEDKHISSAEDVKSIQWARWGRTGKKLADVIPDGFLPDAMNTDGKVDMISDLFGLVFMKQKNNASFAARVVPENLVFKDAVSSVFRNNMPPLSSPHPGCVAFYLQNKEDPYDGISLEDPPRGYKVYRTWKETEQDKEPPWHYDTQPIYNKDDLPNHTPFHKSNMTFSADLLPPDKTGTLRISFRALTRKELAILILALTCDLRLGGGKPLGLGHCIAEHIQAVDENGETILDFSPKPEERATLPPDYEVPKEEFDEFEAIRNRAMLYCKTQLPVEKMRYPRLADENTLGGMVWFSKFATIKKDKTKNKGLQVVEVGGDLSAKIGNKYIKAQPLPFFNPEKNDADVLYGYHVQVVKHGNGIDEIRSPDQIVLSERRKGDNNNQNSKKRRDDRGRRTGSEQ